MSVQTIEAMAKWVENHITEQPTLEDMASHVGYSPYYCSVKFREHIGITYKQFLCKCRLMAAAQDLQITDDSVTKIAFRYGYGSSEALTRAFAQEFHCPPKQYRKVYRTHAHGFSVVRDIGGHGVGLQFHEDPWVSHVASAGTGMLLVPGLIFTIEPMINMGSARVRTNRKDGWTITTADGQPSAQWEKTVLVTDTGAEVLAY